MSVLPIALLIVFWWIGIWGLVETILQPFIKNNYWSAIAVYGAMIVIVLLVVSIHPTVLESLV
jgi:hypothetical protein